MAIKTYNEGNHNEEFGTHMQYEDFKIRTPKNATVPTPNEWVKLIDRNMYLATYLSANPKAVTPPAVNKFITTFLLYSADTDSQFQSCIVTIRANIYSAYNRFSIDILPLSNGDSLSDAQGNLDYTDLLRLYVEDKGSGKFAISVYLKYTNSYMTYRIKTLHTSLNDYAFGYSYLDLLSTEYDLWRYPNTEYRLNQWLWIPESSMTLISENSLPTVSASITKYPSKLSSGGLKVNALPTASQEYVGKIATLVSGSDRTPYICYNKSGTFYWRSLIDYVPTSLTISGAASTVRGLNFQTNSVNRFILRLEDDAESGSNKGSSLSISRRADDGTALGQSILINRDSGRIFMTDGPVDVLASWSKPFKMGSWYIWMDSSGMLRKKKDVPPTSDSDTGVYIGTINTTATTIDGSAYEQYNLQQPSATSITGITNGYEGRQIVLIAFNTNTTLVHNPSGTDTTAMYLKGAVNALVPLNGVITLRYTTGRWYEMFRNF